MPQPPIATQTAGRAEGAGPAEDAVERKEPAPAPLVEADLLVEEVSIDGMCGVY